jgi:uncharacterized protein
MTQAKSNPIWQTAMVTGASAGIGQEIARQLAAGGTNLVLVARDQKRLEDRARHYATEYGVKVEIEPVDLTDPAQLLRIEQRVRDAARPIDLLVNNAGMGKLGTFHDLAVDVEQAVISLNVIALMRLTHAALEQMVPRRSGTILNISSMSGLLPGPKTATYAATKAFVTTFSESIYEELRGTGVSVTASHPGYTRTEFQHRAGMQKQLADVPASMWMSSEEAARQSLRAAEKRKVFHVTGRANSFFANFVGVLPRSLKRSIARRLNQ